MIILDERAKDIGEAIVWEECQVARNYGEERYLWKLIYSDAYEAEVNDTYT